MKCLVFNIKADYGLLKKHEFNNNEITYPFLTKTALIGMIGAVTGIERDDMLDYWDMLLEDMKYNIVLNKKLKTDSIKFYQTNFDNIAKSKETRVPKSAEYILDLDWDVYLLIDEDNGNEKTIDIFNKFTEYVKNERYIYPPKIGRSECSCELSFVNLFDNLVSSKNKEKFYTKGFTRSMITSSSNNVMFETNIYLKQYFNSTDKNILKNNKIDRIYFCDDNKTIQTFDYCIEINESKFIFI